jgi:hypothetical protein
VYYKPLFKNTGIENQMFTDSLSRKSLILGVIFIEISCFWGDKLQCGLIKYQQYKNKKSTFFK